MMELENQVLTFLEKNPDKSFTIVEIANATYRIEITSKNFLQNYSKIWDVVGVLNSLFKKGKVDMKVLDSKKAICFQIKSGG